MKTALIAALLALPACAHFPLHATTEPNIGVADQPGPHDDAQTEWWHVHADLHDTVTGESLHVLVIFVVQRTDLDRVVGLPLSAVVNPFHGAWVRIQDDDRSWTADRYNFPDLFAAGFSEPPGARFGDTLDLHHGDWRVRWEHGVLVLEAGAGDQQVELKLVDTRAPATPGDHGLVELEPGAPHTWVQHEQMAVTGRWQDGGETRWVEGTGFFKHQWGRLYSDRIDGFEWLSMDLPDGNSLSVGWLHDAVPEARRPGQPVPQMRGIPGSLAWVSGPGGAVPIPTSLLSLTPTRTWHSRRSGAEWTVGWKLTGPGFDLDVSTLTDDQEIWAFPAPLYGGPARATGTWFGEPVDVTAFVEQAGARVSPLRALLSSRNPPGATQPTASR